MAYKPSKAALTCTLTLTLETESGGRPAPSQMTRARQALEDAIRSRLFGEGFLPCDIFVDAYGIAIEHQ